MRFYLSAVFIFHCFLHILIGQHQVSAGFLDNFVTPTVQNTFKQAEAPKSFEERMLDTAMPYIPQFIRTPFMARQQ